MKGTYLSIFKWFIILSLTVFYQLFAEFKSEKFLLELVTLESYETGKPVVVNLRITNNSGNAVMLVHGQDGSIHKFRYPHLYYTILNEKNDTLKIMQPIDKVVNPLSSQYFFTLGPGESKDFYEDGFDLSRYFDLKEGVYEIICFYSTDAQKESQWYGAYSDDYWEKIFENSFWLKIKPDMEKCSQMLQKVPEINVSSEPVRIDIKSAVYVSREKALEIAKNVCAQEKWKWDEDKIYVTDQGNEWRIMTNSNSLGMNGIINIDKRTGEVLSKFMTGP